MIWSSLCEVGEGGEDVAFAAIDPAEGTAPRDPPVELELLGSGGTAYAV